MNENIGSRVSRLISGSINALIEKAENISPELIMKESIREMDAAIDEVKVLLGKESVKQKTTQSQYESEKAKYKKLNEQIKIALEENREDLAKAAISRQMDIEVQVPILEDSLAEIEKNIKQLENYIDALNAKKREMKAELEEFAKINKEQNNQASAQSNVEKAEDAFNRVSTSRRAKLLDEDDVKLSELDNLAKENRIAERLASFKAEVKS